VLAGLAGALLAVTAQGLPPADSASPAMALIVLAAALLGGAGRPAGALVGAALFTLAPVLVPAVPAAQEVLAGLVLTAAVVWPAARCGLLGLLDHDPGIG
jgi:ABC-type branched-subunit amino acid transport system permease subunit